MRSSSTNNEYVKDRIKAIKLFCLSVNLIEGLFRWECGEFEHLESHNPQVFKLLNEDPTLINDVLEKAFDDHRNYSENVWILCLIKSGQKCHNDYIKSAISDFFLEQSNINVTSKPDFQHLVEIYNTDSFISNGNQLLKEFLIRPYDIIDRYDDLVLVENSMKSQNIIDDESHIIKSKLNRNNQCMVGVYELLFEYRYFKKFDSRKPRRRCCVTRVDVQHFLDKRYDAHLYQEFRKENDYYKEIALKRLPIIEKLEAKQ